MLLFWGNLVFFWVKSFPEIAVQLLKNMHYRRKLANILDESNWL